MAFSVTNWVWDHSRSTHGSRLVMLALADYGQVSWPSVATLSRKAKLGERAVHTAIADLVGLGELAVDRNGGPKGCNLYRIIMRGGADSAPPQNLHPAESAPLQNQQDDSSSQVMTDAGAETAGGADSAGVQISTSRGAESAPRTVSDPSKNSSTKSSMGNAAGPATLFGEPAAKTSRRKSAATPASRIPDDFAVDADMRDWALKSVPGYDFDAETDNFIDYWRAKAGSAATKADWPATWRTWMRRAAKEAPQAPRRARQNGHEPYRNPVDQSVYDRGFGDD